MLGGSTFADGLDWAPRDFAAADDSDGSYCRDAPTLALDALDGAPNGEPRWSRRPTATPRVDAARSGGSLRRVARRWRRLERRRRADRHAAAPSESSCVNTYALAACGLGSSVLRIRTDGSAMAAA